MSTSSGFGRRPPFTREAMHAGEVEPDGASDRSLPCLAITGPLLGVVVGFAVVALLLGVNVSAMKGFGRALDTYWAGSAGFPNVEDAFKRTAGADRKLEEIHNDCKSRSDFVGRNRPKTEADVLSADEISVGQAVTYVTCLATEQPARFCEPVHRAQLLAAVRDYYRLKGKLREEHLLMNAGPLAFNRSALIGNPWREMLPTTAPLGLESDPRIVGALRALVVGGYVSRAELVGAGRGWPSDLDTALQSVEPRRKGCKS